MQVMIHVRGKDGKRRRVLLSEWIDGTDPLTVYNNLGMPVYMTRPGMRWSGVTEIYRSEIVGTWKEHCHD